MPVTQCLTKTPEVVARDFHKPFADATVDASSPLIRDLLRRGCADQVVRELQSAAGFDNDAPRHQLARSVLSPLLRPAVELGRAGQRKRAGSNRKHRKQRPRIHARAAQTRRDEPTRVHFGTPASRKRIKPEW
jgi:hypothetical protein